MIVPNHFCRNNSGTYVLKVRKTISVSENDSVSSQAQQHSHGLRKTGSDCADMTCYGRLFQTRAAATGKARSAMVDKRVRPCVRRMTNDEAERSHVVSRNPPAHRIRQQDTRQRCFLSTPVRIGTDLNEILQGDVGSRGTLPCKLANFCHRNNALSHPPPGKRIP